MIENPLWRSTVDLYRILRKLQEVKNPMTPTAIPGTVSEKSQDIPGGVVHSLPADVGQALSSSTSALSAWHSITPLARNEFICWIDDAKQEATRQRRIRIAVDKLENGERRPCCWPGCKHRERNGK